MNVVVKEAYNGIKKHHGGPFGCVIIKNNKIISKAHNKVLKNNDTTCHAEVCAIRKASKKLRTYDLSECILYTTVEPCNMCLCACMWANISKIYYGCSLDDTDKIGFRDKKFDEYLGERKINNGYLNQIDYKECFELFDYYKSIDKQIY